MTPIRNRTGRALVLVAAVYLGLGGLVFLAAALVDDPLGLVRDVDPGRLVATGLDAVRGLLPRLALAALAAAFLTGCYLALRSWTPVRDDIARSTRLVVRRGATALPSTQRVDQRLRRFQQRHPDRAAVLFFQMLTDNRYWLRLEEVFTVVGRSVHLVSRAQFQFDRGELDDVDGRLRLIVPLLVLPKGALLDDFVVTDDCGNRLAVVSRDDSRSAILVVLHGLYCETLRAADPALVPRFLAELTLERGLDAVPSRSWYVAFYRELEQLISLTPAADPGSAVAYFRDAQRAWVPAEYRERLGAPLLELEGFCERYAERYVLAVDCPAPDGCHLLIEYRQTRRLRASRGDVKERVRRFLGLEPRRIRIPANPTRRFAHYHAEVEVGSGRLYVGEQQVTATGRTITEIPPGAAPPRIADRVSVRNESDDHPHLYLVPTERSMDRAPVEWQVKLEEIPPGALSPVLAMAGSALLIFAAFAFTLPVALGRPGGVDADSAALVVAIPLFTLTVFGYSFERMLHSSLGAVFGFVATGVLVLLGAIGLLAADPGQVTSRVTVLGRPFHEPMMICALLSAAIMAFVLVTWLLRMRRYLDRDRREREYAVAQDASRRRGPDEAN
jgi:hypothetical protein